MDDYLIVYRAVILIMLLGVCVYVYLSKSVFCKYLSCDLVQILWASLLITLF